MMPNAIETAVQYNEAFYEEAWRRMRLFPPESLPWWPVIRALADAAPDRLEVGPGLFPRLPLAGTHVVELSAVALQTLETHGAIAHHGPLQEQGLAEASIDLVGIFEVLEHVPDDVDLVRELARITRPGGHLMLSVPLGMKYYNAYDRFMGHVRRYEPNELRTKIESAGYVLERFEVRASSPREPVASLMVWLMIHAPNFSVWMLRDVMLPMAKYMRINWQDASQWERGTRNATDCSAIFRRAAPSPA
jgi:SAM-dependent methyltransferase